MFVKNSLALQDAVDCILIIFERLIINLGGLEEVAKLQQWRDAEAVRSIANRTDNIPHMLIGVDKYVHWMENISTPGIPFPNWHQAIFPPIKSIAGHPWLLTVEWQFDAGLSSTMPHMTTTGSKGHIPTHSTWSAKGKARATPEELAAISEEKLITQEDDNGDKSKFVEEDIEMDEAIVEPVHGRSKKRGRKGLESEGEDMEDSPAPPPRKKPCLLKAGQTDPLSSSVQLRQVRSNAQVQDNSMQMHQVDMDTTVTSSNVVKMQHKTVQSPHLEAESREVTPTHGEPPVVGQSVGMLSTESSDSGGQDH
ncbi:hypothetical protein F5141DRAFT_1060123 [Pisolithus sp. B1]|nr:hypothetical protein F5141DRAFT_1060123 [Pisolithus sp. B1]